MLSHPDRKDRICVFSVDPVLATDVHERLSSHPDTRDYEVSGTESGQLSDSISTIERTSRDSVSARVLILDVRSHTLPGLQHAYNKISGYNRWDLNQLCYVVLIGDGPPGLFDVGGSLDMFVPHLAELRQDYRPAAFFFDPFLHYSSHEQDAVGLESRHQLPPNIPERLAMGFQEDDAGVAAVRRYFRAARLSGDEKDKAIERRQGQLAKLFEHRIARAFPHHTAVRQSWLATEGYAMPGEALALHVYPFFFEEWVGELMRRAKEPAIHGVG